MGVFTESNASVLKRTFYAYTKIRSVVLLTMGYRSACPFKFPHLFSLYFYTLKLFIRIAVVLE